MLRYKDTYLCLRSDKSPEKLISPEMSITVAGKGLETHE